MRAIVIGNLGYLGPVVIQELARCFEGIIIDGFDTGFFPDPQIKTAVEDEILRKCIIGDVRDLSSDLVGEYDVFILLAALSNDPVGEQYDLQTSAINAEYISRLFSGNNLSGKIIVFASSCSVYGINDTQFVDEKTPVMPLTAYSKSKVLAERLLDQVIGGGKLTKLRFATACGASPRQRFDLALNSFVANAYFQNIIDITSNGKPYRPMIDVRDMARAVVWSINRNIDDGGTNCTVNVGNTENNFTIRELAEKVTRQFEDCHLKINKNAPDDQRSYRVNFEKFKKIAPNYYPKFKIEDSINCLKEVCMKIEENNDDFNGPNFNRLSMLRLLQSRNQLNDDLRWNE
ncbi:MAG: hypothetical protein CBB97_24280 [Candidatus Endolissoclinum sp. TMED37]|nr:MAG: hypothetical protein CBB97_24280 [Candidatus Endolissoclinum sp. TMED37]